MLKEKNVIAFTATTSLSYERLIHNCVVPPSQLRVKSEYELIHERSPVQHANIITCTDDKALFAIMEADMIGVYDKKPIIIIYDKP